MQNFVPEVLYTTWCNAHGIDLTKYPYMKMDYVPSRGGKLPYAVFDTQQAFDTAGNALKWFVVRYKCLYSKDYHDITIYL